MTKDLLAKHWGVIYECSSDWACGRSKFVVSKMLDDISYPTRLVVIKLLNNIQYQGLHLLEPGYACITLGGIEGCRIVGQTDTNIMTYVKAILCR